MMHVFSVLDYVTNQRHSPFALKYTISFSRIPTFGFARDADFLITAGLQINFG
jgi:hypothetical protein